jgi:cellulose synthase/poly-beta-1,6-N-acetylglucosamine synthase-like glycosyltransferase
LALQSASALYLIYIGASLLLGAIAGTTLVWTVHAWRTPDGASDDRVGVDEHEPTHSFSLIVPARHEQAVLEATLTRLVRSGHPAFEVLVVVGHDDPETREAAERMAQRHPELIKVIVDHSWPKSKPKALNAALPYCTGTVTGVFDAEDDVHPALLRRVDHYFQRTDADVVQAGVQLMNFHSSWLTVRNVLEYYFWFRSRLHLHARQRFIPLGGNTVFIRTDVLRTVSGWDPECLAEDCELGVRLSALGARTVVFYEPEVATREECPATLGAFIRQRTRWNQGYLQTLSRGYWRRLPLRQRLLGNYILASPFVMALAWLFIPIAIGTAVAVAAPVPITLVSFLPALPILSILVVEVVGLGEFCRAYGQRPSVRDYARLVVGLPLYQVVLAFAAARAVAREIRGARGWEKTEHFGLHLGLGGEASEEPGTALGVRPRRPRRPQRAAARSRHLVPQPVAQAVRHGLAISNSTAAPELAGASTSNGDGHGQRWLIPAEGSGTPLHGDPLWVRLDGGSTSGSATVPLPGIRPIDLGEAGRRALGAGRSLIGGVAKLRIDVVLPVVLLAGVAVVLATNMLHWPGAQFDEGTYVGNAWAVQHGKLAPYTYSYGHPPLGWLLIFLWTWANGVFGHATFSIDSGRELMLVVSLVSCWLLYTLARRLSFGRVAAAGAVVLFALSPLAIAYHRAVLLDNPSIAWALAAFVLARSPQRRLWAFAASGACFALAVLSKETTLVLVPTLALAAVQNTDRRTRRYCLTLFASFFVVVVLAYPLYATLKGELLQGKGHVSLLGYTVLQLFTRQGTGSLLDPHSQTHAIVTAWLHLDPWLLGAALALSPIALVRRSTRAVALAFLIQVILILRPGYLPNMYVIGLLPFAALIVTGSIEALVRRWRLIALPALAWGLAAVIAVPALAVVVKVAEGWAQGDQIATTSRLDSAMRAAERWLVDNVPRDKRIIVTDDFWIYMIEHGFDSHPMPGGFYSRTVVSYWPLSFDPAVQKQFPHGWRDFDYIVLNQDMRVTLTNTRTAADAVNHSRVLVSFGSGAQLIEIRAIDRPRPGSS